MNPQKKELTRVCAVLFLAMFTLVGSAWSQTPTAADADFNGNGEVEFNDFLLFVEKFNTRQGDNEYEARYDLDGDGAVNFADFLSFVGVFGQRVSSSPPVAHAGEYQSVDTGDLVTLNGANSSDPEGQPLTFVWRQVEGPQVTLSDPQIARPTFRPSEAGHYAFELIVNDGVLSSQPDTVGVDAVTISEDAVFVGGADAAFEYKEMTSDSMMVFTARAGAPQVQVGEVLVNTDGPFFLKKVTRVVRQNASEVVVETEDAALTDVVKEADIRQTLSFPATKLAVADLPSLFNVCLADTAGESFSLCASASNISLSPSIDFKINIQNGAVDSLHLGAQVIFTASFEINLETSTELVGLEKEINLTKRLGRLAEGLEKALKFGKLALPVQVTPAIGLGVKGSVSVAGEVNAGVDIQRTFGAGITYKNGNIYPVKTGEDQNQNEREPWHEISLHGKAQLRAYVSGGLEVAFGKSAVVVEVGVGAASFSLEPYFGFDADTSPISNEQTDLTIDWKIGMGVDVEASINGPYIRFFGLVLRSFTKSWGFTLRETILKSGNVPLLVGPILVGTNLQGITTSVHDPFVRQSGLGNFYMVYASNPKVYAYQVKYDKIGTNDGVPQWIEIADQGFDLHPDNGSPTGITYEYTDQHRALWVVDASDNKVQLFQYGADGTHRQTYTHDDNIDPVGITYANNRFYVVNDSVKKVYVYGVEDGFTHFANLDFNLDDNNSSPNSITYVNNRFYVVDGEDAKVYVYERSGARVSDSDFNLYKTNKPPVGITYANNRFYVVHSNDGKIYEYGRPDLIVVSPFVSDSDATLTAEQSFTLSATVRNQGIAQADSLTLRYYLSPNETISTSDEEIGRASIASLNGADSSAELISLTAPSTLGTYYYGACVDAVDGEEETDNNCSEGVRVAVSGNIGTPSTVASFDLSINVMPRAITYANDRFYVLDWGDRDKEGDEKVFVYTSSGHRDSASDFDLDDNNNLPGSIAYANGRFYVLDWGDGKVYAYTSSGHRDSASDFDLGGGDELLMTYANNRFYVFDNRGVGSANVYVFDSSGARDSASDFVINLHFHNSDPWDITYANDRFYVIDRDQHVYSYTSSGHRDSNVGFFLESNYLRRRSGYSLTYANDRFYVLDGGESEPGDEKVLAYKSSGPGSYQRDSASDFDLDSNILPFGLTYANGRFYVVDVDIYEEEAKVYAYTGSGHRDSASDFNLDENSFGADITYANNRFYMLNSDRGEVYAYTGSGHRDSASDFVLDDSNNEPLGHTYANGRFYVVYRGTSDPGDEKVYAYTSSGHRDSASDFDLDSHILPVDLTYANDRFYVVDWGDRDKEGDEKVYAYTGSGHRDSASDFDLDDGNSDPLGLTYVNGRFYVVDWGDRYKEGDEKVYSYADKTNDNPALAALYNATDGQNWKYSTNWLENVPVEDWYGVSTNAQGQVDSLNLSENLLRGMLPEELGNLTNLTYLDLRRNQLTGPIPSSLGDLTQLQILALHENQLTGPIPAALGNLKNLTYLTLHQNRLTGSIPSSLGNLTNLTTELNLSRNQLTGTIPENLGNLTKLKKLYLFDNQLNGEIPATLGNLTNLTELYLQDNQLTGPIPLAFRNLTNLEHLGLGNNADLCLPVSMQTWAASRQLSDAQSLPACSSAPTITDANLRAVIADSLGKTSGEAITSAEMATLTRLDAPNKGIRDLTGLEHATNLIWLNLGSASVNGEWVNSNAISDLSPLFGLTSLRALGLDRNSITNISPLSGLTSLQVLYLGVNAISDLSPLSGLTKLARLNLDRNSISDLSPLSGLTGLQELGLSNNSIANLSPLSGLTGLQVLGLDRNSITDISPLSGLTRLTWLDLGFRNSITDISPLSGLTSLQVLGLINNSISDISPLSGLTRLTGLFLGGNNRISEVSALSGLTNLTRLGLEINSITDISPLSGLTGLQVLGLSNNSISNLAPLVANTGLGRGDLVDVRRNPLSTTSLNTHIPALQARGVTVYFGTSKPAVGDEVMPMPRAAMNMFGDEAWERNGSVSLWRMADKDR